MSPSDPPPEIGLSWQMREHEARLLADSLRTSRLTLLYAGAGASRSALLAKGVVPLLARREADFAAGGFFESRVVVPFVDRRNADGVESGSPVVAERVIYFSHWGPDPISALTAVIRTAVPHEPADVPANARLADVVEALCGQLKTRLLIVLDGFETFWTAGAGTSEADRFVESFGEAVDRPRLPVNFLLAVDDRWESRLEPLRRAIRGFDDSTVRLLGFERAGEAPALPGSARRQAPSPSMSKSTAPQVVPLQQEPPTLSDAIVPEKLAALVVPGASLRPPPRRNRSSKKAVAVPAPIKADGVYAFIESRLTQTADASDPWQDVDVPTAAAVPARTVAPAAVVLQIALPSTGEPPSPIDEWLDSAIAWCRRMLGSR